MRFLHLQTKKIRIDVKFFIWDYVLFVIMLSEYQNLQI